MKTELAKKRWIILILCCLSNVCLGSVYAWSVFAAPMAEHLSGITGKSVTSADLGIVYTTINVVGTFTMIGGGWVNDKFGPRGVFFTGSLLYTFGLILSGFATTVGALILSYGIVGGMGLGMAYGCTIGTCVKFFPDRRGLTGGLTTAAYGFGSVILPPVVMWLIQYIGVASTFRLIGIIFMGILCMTSLFFEKCPNCFIPEGWKPGMPEKRNDRSEKNWKEMIITFEFYMMMCMLTCGAINGAMVTSQASAIAMDLMKFSILEAGTAVSVLALFNTGGRLISGLASDKIGRLGTLTAAYLLSIMGSLILYSCKTGEKTIFYFAIGAVGISLGALMGVFPSFTADQFGTKHNSLNYGIMMTGNAVASFLGPALMRSILYADGTYRRAFLLSAVFGSMGILMTVIYRILRCHKY